MNTRESHVSMITEDYILNPSRTIASFFLLLDYGSSVYFHNNLRSLNSKRLTSVKYELSIFS